MRKYAPDLRILLRSRPHAPTFRRGEVCRMELNTIINKYGIPIKIAGMPYQFDDVKGGCGRSPEASLSPQASGVSRVGSQKS